METGRRWSLQQRDSSSELSPEEIPPDHLAGRDPRRTPQSGEVECAAEAVEEAKEQHRRDPAADILEGEATVGHTVLLDLATDEVVHVALAVDFGLVFACLKCPLLAL